MSAFPALWAHFRVHLAKVYVCFAKQERRPRHLVELSVKNVVQGHSRMLQAKSNAVVVTLEHFRTQAGNRFVKNVMKEDFHRVADLLAVLPVFLGFILTPRPQLCAAVALLEVFRVIQGSLSVLIVRLASIRIRWGNRFVLAVRKGLM